MASPVSPRRARRAPVPPRGPCREGPSRGALPLSRRGAPALGVPRAGVAASAAAAALGPTALPCGFSRCGSSSGLLQVQISGHFPDPSALSALGDQQPGFPFPSWALADSKSSATLCQQEGPAQTPRAVCASDEAGRVCWRTFLLLPGSFFPVDSLSGSVFTYSHVLFQ